MTSKSTPAAQDMRNHGKRPAVAGLAAVAVAGLIAACGSGSSSAAAGGGGTQQAGGGTQQAAAGLTVSSRQVSGAGTVLTNQSGRTLYTPEQEANGSIKCTGSCLGFWFPVTMTQGGATPHAASGVTGKLGSLKRPDNGDLQLTYNGDPLYTFRLDSAPGQAHGNNFTDSFGGQTFLWHVATISGAAPAGGQPASPSGNGGYNY